MPLQEGETMSELEQARPPVPPTASPVPDFVDRVRDAITVRRVFGDPVERDGVTVIPAAYVGGGGGGGGGSGTQPDGQVGSGSGGGFGVKARPAGALVIRDGDVRWEPALDPERRLAMYTTLGVVAIVALRTLLPRRRRRRRH
jgi:uncharacterized spore protein YtfJ